MFNRTWESWKFIGNLFLFWAVQKTKQEAFSKQKEVTFIIQEKMLWTVRLNNKITAWQQDKIFTIYLEGSSW